MLSKRLSPSSRGRTLFAAGLAVLALTGPAAADTYQFDKQHTNISFTWDHLGLSRQSGRILDFDGIVEFDPATPESGAVAVSLKVASIWTGVEALDRHLRTPDFFDAERHPTITFKSTSAIKTGERMGEVAGNLTIMGVTRPVTLKVIWNFSGEHPLGRYNANYQGKFVSGFTAMTRILRSEWGLKRAIPLASDEIEITINTELIRK